MRWRSKIAITAGCCLAIWLLFRLLLLHPSMSTPGLRLGGRLVELLAPAWLGLLSLLPLLWLVRSASLVDLSRLQQGLSVALRALLLVAIALALARPSVTTEERRTSVVFLVDVSQSIADDQLAAARRMVAKAWRDRGTNEVRLITFAQRPRVLALDPARDELPPLARHGNGRAGQHSDIQAALQHAQGLFPPDRVPRIVLLSDGNETGGDMLAEAYRAAERKVRIHVHNLPPRKQREILVRSLVAPSEIRMGAPFELTATIYSTHRDRVRLTLYKDEFINGLDGRRTLELRPGRNVAKFKSLVRESGFVSYRLAMSGFSDDTWPSNNSARALLPVLGRPRVLYVEGEPLYASYLQRALAAEKIDVTVRGPHGIPNSATQLAKFDLVIISDVPALYLGLSQMAAIEQYVRDLGGGLIMAGGPNSFGAGGYYGTRIEKILPVRLDTEKKRDQPSVAIALCIDRSGSMSGPKIELAKDAAKATTELLGSSDMIGVIAFDSAAHVVVRLQRAANRLRILNDIARLSSGGGTNIKPALQEAYTQLQTANAKVKHVILLSDGQSSYGGIPELIDEMAAAKITVSAVGVGGGADRTLLQMIAERGSGRFYHTNDASNIPKIFTKETTQVARSALVEELVKVRVLKRANVIEGINFDSAPYLRGYVSTKPKQLSETILVSDLGEPLLAMWRVGLGKTAAFTSDVKNRWAVDWLRWPGYGQFWAQLAREIMRHRVQRSFEIKARVRGGRVRAVVNAVDRADRFINGLDSELLLIDPERPRLKQRTALVQTASGRYEATLELKRYGAFILRARHRVDGQVVAESLTSLAAPYPAEYTHVLPKPGRLRRVALVSGGVVDPSTAAIFDAGPDRIRYHRDLWPWVLGVLIGLFLLDVLLRRLRLFGYRVDSL